MNWIVLIILGLFAVALIVFAIIRNQKDQSDFEEEMNNDYPKSVDKKGEFDDDGL